MASAAKSSACRIVCASDMAQTEERCPVILVFGSINVDVLVPLPVLPRPGDTVLGGDYALLPGGKGANQAVAACRAGAAVRMAGAIGDDSFAPLALESL